MSLPAIHVSGRNFATPDGKVWKYVGVSAFGLFKRWLMHDGPNALVAPIIAEWRSLAAAGGYSGPIVLRVFRYAGNGNAFAVDPRSYAFNELTAFTQFCGDRGFYVDWTCGDSQFVLPAPADQQQHLNETCAALVGTPNAFIQTCNEPFKNGIDVGQVVPPVWGPALRSSGFYTDTNAWNHAFDLDFIDFHPDRSTEYLPDGEVAKWLGKMFETAVYLARFAAPVIYGEPIGADEVDIPGRRSANPALFRRAGLSIGLLAGITFHSTAGLASDGLGPVQKACAANWFFGVNQALAI